MKNLNGQALVFLCLLLLVCTSCSHKASRDVLDLQGNWRFSLDSLDKGEEGKWYSVALGDEIILPGTTDTNKKGFRNTRNDETTYLSREYPYRGKAWYQKEITVPEGWHDKTLHLTLERTKPTKLWIDETYVGSSDKISVAQVYDLTGKLTPGDHTITLMVDNGFSVPNEVISNSHAYTESTQTNWNGIIGKIQIEAMPALHIRDVLVYPDLPTRTATVKVRFQRPGNISPSATLSLTADARNTTREHMVKTEETITLDKDEVTMKLSLGDDAVLWDEFDPGFYRLSVDIRGKGVYDTYAVDFGLREFKVKGTQFVINENVTFLRGKHDACVFPLTGHVAMDVASWQNYFRIAKSYGINHYRFHSWCPPEACFEAANIEGIYLQPELPFWGSMQSENTKLLNFLTREGIDIQLTYGNHPSFVMFALGNELSGEQKVMTEMVETFRKADDRHLYATGSNNYLGFRKNADIDEYFTTCRVGAEVPGSFNTHARGSFSFADAYDGGYINHTYPNTVMNFDTAVRLCSVPIISHETGQFQVYPNYDEMKKYTGVLQPRNFEIFRERLEKAGMLDQAKDFFLASGKWAALLYRADIEMDLRTKEFGGFQLLDLQDYPGQGSAFVGILDAFMDSKGLITPEEWREFCSEVVPMFSTEKFCYTDNEPINGDILIANYSRNAFDDSTIRWEWKDENDNVVDKGSRTFSAAQGRLANIGNLRPDVQAIDKARKITLTLSIDGTPYKNSYPFWIYPSSKVIPSDTKITVTDRMDNRTRQILQEGGKVLWFPDHKEMEDVTVGGLFQTDYWNYRMFKSICERIGKPVSPGTLGLLMKPEHPLFNDFPTDFHTNMQWFSMVKNSRPFILDRMPGDYKPIVQVIDNIERNHKLGLIFEFAVDKGKLLVCMSDLAAIQDKPEARQLYAGILSYMESDAFAPASRLDYDQLIGLFRMPTETEKIKVLDNISY